MNSTEDQGKLKDQVLTWSNRAAMARKAGQDELASQALDRCWKFQKMLAPILDLEIPPRPQSPEEVWQWLGGVDIGPPGRNPGPSGDTGPSGDPEQPSGVPRKPLPFSGAGAIALPLPPKEENDS